MIDQKIFLSNIEFVAGIEKISKLPSGDYPEFAFIGRSNVGKSSLLNSLTNRKSLARVSNTPGRTKQLNFFLVSNKIMLVDLPGYGYAKASKVEIAKWSKLIEYYFTSRNNLRMVFLLIDGRRGVLASDIEQMRFYDNIKLNYTIVFTKIDKISKLEFEKILEVSKKQLIKMKYLAKDFIFTSNKDKIGIDNLRESITRLINEV